ncbi:MAG: hypothetical protein HQL93_11040 [Magnetococcales bacterium]|nr:hypothetical protein [Magnetococcales bacterium]
MIEQSQQTVHHLVDRAESLAFSSDWIKTARIMRSLLQKWNELEFLQKNMDDELTRRFRAAQQTFMERRAEYFYQGNLRKGAGLMSQLEDKQKKIIALKNDIFKTLQALHDFERQLQDIADSEHEISIRAFILESIHFLNQEILTKEKRLTRLEQTTELTTNRYYCVE